MATKKSSKKAPTQKKRGTVLVCSSCHSPHATVLMIDGIPRYVCQRCGHVSKLQVKHDKAEAQALVRRRRSHAVRSHLQRQERRDSALVSFVGNYRLRMWFKIVSTFIIGFGLVLIPSVELATGILFLFIGIIGLYASMKWM